MSLFGAPKFDVRTAIVSFSTGFLYSAALWLTLDAFMTRTTTTNSANETVSLYLPLQAYQCIPLILAFVFILPLFLMDSSVIRRDDGFGFYDENKCRRRVFFVLLSLQFLPFLGSVAFLFRDNSEQNPLPIDLDIQLIIATGLCLLGALLQKTGTYRPKGDDYSF